MHLSSVLKTVYDNLVLLVDADLAVILTYVLDVDCLGGVTDGDCSHLPSDSTLQRL